jgi:hypothetical protein
VLAHESWFTEIRPPYEWGFLFEAPTLALVLSAIAVAAAWRWAAWRLPVPEIGVLRPLGRLAPYVPRLLGIHAGVSLLAQAARGTYLAPSLDLPSNPFGSALAIAEGVLGVWLITGYRLRWPAALLVIAGPVGMFGYGAIPILERVDLLGIALFLVVLPPGNTPAGAVDASPRRVAFSLLSLRTLVGGSLVVLAFTEKLIRPDLALVFLDRFPGFNVARTLGIPIGDVMFVRIAGAVELLVGLLLISGALPQLAVLVAAVPFNATLFFLGAEELIGHLPIYGSMLALLVYGSDPTLAPLTRWFPWHGEPADIAGGARGEPKPPDRAAA